MWRGLDYHYSKTVLKAIAAYYGENTIYSVLDRIIACDPCSVVEYKADFDMALNAIGKCHEWSGDVDTFTEFKYYRQFGRLQQVIIAEVIGTEDEELERCGFDDIPKCKAMAFSRMARYLNTGELHNKDHSTGRFKTD
jgi:hypothetical protein